MGSFQFLRRLSCLTRTLMANLGVTLLVLLWLAMSVLLPVRLLITLALVGCFAWLACMVWLRNDGR